MPRGLQIVRPCAEVGCLLTAPSASSWQVSERTLGRFCHQLAQEPGLRIRFSDDDMKAVAPLIGSSGLFISGISTKPDLFTPPCCQIWLLFVSFSSLVPTHQKYTTTSPLASVCHGAHSLHTSPKRPVSAPSLSHGGGKGATSIAACPNISLRLNTRAILTLLAYLRLDYVETMT